ncbi:hypothetical+protein [Methylocapsa aurea]|uniref:hypothetical protein n=1 Tax=Methylocapsa aurea TaxID=663610 RepID=UPI003D188B82
MSTDFDHFTENSSLSTVDFVEESEILSTSAIRRVVSGEVAALCRFLSRIGSDRQTIGFILKGEYPFAVQ